MCPAWLSVLAGWLALAVDQTVQLCVSRSSRSAHSCEGATQGDDPLATPFFALATIRHDELRTDMLN